MDEEARRQAKRAEREARRGRKQAVQGQAETTAVPAVDTPSGAGGRQHDLAGLARQVELLRNKFFVLQEALVRSGREDLMELNGPLAEIAPVEMRRVPSSRQTVIAFAGMATALSMPPAEFLGALGGDRDINILYVKDFRQCWYQMGLLGLSHDVPSTVDYLRRLVPPDQSIVTVGTSAGGYAAILFGVLLGARHVIAFGPQTRLDKRVFNRFASVDSRLREMNRGTHYFDLLQLLQEQAFGGRIDVHYSSEHPVDVEAAKRMGVLPCVRLHEHPGDAHAVARTMRDSGELARVFEDILGKG